ncbi:DUF397 domain-containing protein [Haloechinothrix sp. LS1_15]|uniref:DUF397 domain-containing protein n=1 Tax=Haloechinothrix sp. LS1_15 TaxID=2652248 RepID=UPI0029470E06|nr:DUF397 domain-containing protein [Haloechinothrix sp. LS1_15]MDV6012297.1 DUF397 domain-containing protein [Haloechinothrix sp. LS1_15]
MEHVKWRKPTRSGTHGNCVELAVEPGRTRIRDTKDREGGALEVPFGAWRAFVASLPER